MYGNSTTTTIINTRIFIYLWHSYLNEKVKITLVEIDLGAW